MEHQEDGWPLGLQLLNMRIGLIRNQEFSGSISFNTMITGSGSSSDSSSDLDTESTGSFFHDKSITFGNLIGISSVLEGQGRLARFRRGGESKPHSKKNHRSKPPCFSLCIKPRIDGENTDRTPSLGHFLEVERKRDRNSFRFVLHDIHEDPLLLRTNSLFRNG